MSIMMWINLTLFPQVRIVSYRSLGSYVIPMRYMPILRQLAGNSETNEYESGRINFYFEIKHISSSFSPT